MTQFVKRNIPSIEEQHKAIDEFSNTCLNFFSPMYEMLMSEYMKLRTKLKYKDMFKHQLKKNTNDGFKELQRLVDHAESYMGNKEVWFSFVSNCEDDMAFNINSLREAILKFFKRKGVVEYELWAQLQVTYILANECMVAFDEIAEEYTYKSHRNITQMFWEFCPKKVLHTVNLIKKDVTIRQDIHIDLNESKTIMREFIKMRAKFLNKHFIDRAIRKTRKAYPMPKEENKG